MQLSSFRSVVCATLVDPDPPILRERRRRRKEHTSWERGTGDEDRHTTRFSRLRVGPKGVAQVAFLTISLSLSLWSPPPVSLYVSLSLYIYIYLSLRSVEAALTQDGRRSPAPQLLLTLQRRWYFVSCNKFPFLKS